MTNQNDRSDLEDDVVLYEVKKVLKSKVVDGEKYYLIKWKDWPDEYNSWESEKTLQPIKALIDLFNEKNQEQEVDIKCVEKR